MNKEDELKATIAILNPDVIGITESWATPDVNDSELHMDGYCLFRKDRVVAHKGGGVLLYVRSSLQPVTIELSSTFQDFVCCRIDSLLIVVCYRSDNSAIVGLENNNKLCELVREINWQ